MSTSATTRLLSPAAGGPGPSLPPPAPSQLQRHGRPQAEAGSRRQRSRAQRGNRAGAGGGGRGPAGERQRRQMQASGSKGWACSAGAGPQPVFLVSCRIRGAAAWCAPCLLLCSPATASLAARCCPASTLPPLRSLPQPGRNEQLCILALPADMGFAELCTFMGAYFERVRAEGW